MKSRVKLSRFSLVMTIVAMALLLYGLYATYGNPNMFALLVTIIAVLLIVSLFYCPVSISAQEEGVLVHSPLKRHSIPMWRIMKVERFIPTMGSIRIFGSGGFMGYWGIFKEGDVGRYVAYYGKSSDCFIIYLDNGDKYVVGCENPDEMVDYISSKIAK